MEEIKGCLEICKLLEMSVEKSLSYCYTIIIRNRYVYKKQKQPKHEIRVL